VEPLWHRIVQGLHGIGIHLDDRAAGSIAAAGNQVSGAMDLPSLLALAAALGWASGFRLYAVVFLVGAAGQAGWIALPPGLAVLQHPALLIASGVLLCVEFFADKIPGVDSLWDLMQSVIRIPAGAALAAGALGADGATAATIAMLMFNKILIANRGEIACRVAATARRMGMRTVAVYSDADAHAKHVAACDEAVHIGGSAPKDSYLRWERIIEAAQATGAQAIHPGYGFLSENEDFAQACAEAGLVFIGPPPSAIKAMGLKAESKQLMERAGVPLVPGYHGADQDPRCCRREADRIGYPVLIKASAGGGGKGMRAVDKAEDFAAALASASARPRTASATTTC
jgi:hypothetical protein